MAARGRKQRSFEVVVATDDSKPSRAAVATAAGFCWPAHARLHAIAVRELALDLGGPARDELEAAAEEASERARRAFARRGRATARVIDGPVGPALLATARGLRARALVVGTRGHGPVRRLVLGSTSRFLVRESRTPLLIVRERPARGGRVVLGVDGSPQSRRAAAFLASLEPRRGARVTLVCAVEQLRMPSLGSMPARVRESLRVQAAALAEEKLRKARRSVDATARRLTAAGWGVQAEVREGIPLEVLLARARSERADLLAVGARGVGGVRRWLLGSVAEGVLQHAGCAVLITH
jgi:nucleotide-binding universal stress UspA family protein